MSDWLNDVDWGNAPAWVAAMTAVVAGTFTVINVRIARKAYEDSTWDRKVAQARLVWALAGPCVGKRKGSKTGDMGRELLKIERHLTIGDSPADYEAAEENGERVVVVTSDLCIFRVEIRNDSNEPIGSIGVTLYGSRPSIPKEQRPPEWKSMRWEHHAYRYTPKVIPPQKTVVLAMVVPESLRSIQTRHTHVTLSFTDSAGHRWERTDTRPPKEVPKPKKPRYPKVRAWWFRRKRQLSKIRKRA